MSYRYIKARLVIRSSYPKQRLGAPYTRFKRSHRHRYLYHRRLPADPLSPTLLLVSSEIISPLSTAMVMTLTGMIKVS